MVSTRALAASSAPRYASGSFVRTTVVRTPSSSSIRVSSGTGLPPTISWAPVLATNPLYRILNVMLAPAATQNRMFRNDEWNSEPSPTFCTMCGRSVYGWSPIHGRPSPPSWVIETMCRSGCSMTEANE